MCMLTAVAAADRELLLAIIRISKISANNNDIAAELSGKFNTTLTGKSIENRIYRLKKMAEGG